MNVTQIEIQIIGAVVAITCALPGVFLVLRKMAMLSDAISHTILLGIVLAFFITKDLNSPLLILAAALTGVLTVILVEILNRTKLVKEDTAIGLVFPILFSIGIILISRYAGDIHLDIDSVLLGELAFAPFNRFVVWGKDIGPKALYIMSSILVLNIIFILIFYKELKLVTFDVGLAAALGFSPAIIHYSMMSLVSITAVGAFDAVGSILVVALMIAPPAAAYLLTDRLSVMIGLSATIGVISAISGYWLAHLLDASIAGSMATMAGLVFALVYLFSPDRGLVSIIRRRMRQRWEFAQIMLTVHLYQHEDLAEAQQENRVEHCYEHLKWEPDFAKRVIREAESHGLIHRMNGFLKLSDKGRFKAQKAIEGDIIST